MFKGEKIHLRALEPSDIDTLYLWENDPALWNTGITVSPFSRFTLNEYLKNAHDDILHSKQLRLVICKVNSDEAIGFIDLFDLDIQHSRAGVGVLIYPEKEKRKGYAVEALNLIKDYAFNFLHLNQLYANIANENTSSRNLFIKCGFKNTASRINWLRTSTGFADELLFQCFSESK